MVRNALAALIYFLLILHTNAEESHHKRGVPSGFTGVRGKKSIPDSAYSSTDGNDSFKPMSESASLAGGLETLGSSSDMEKRKIYGFVGMRGKKPWEDEELFKRAPMGFFGMRGKKDDWDNEVINEYFPKRAPMGFFGMRGKKFVLQPNYLDEKRAPMGFVGMRGKKDFEGVSSAEDKRAPSGFFGMRGKKGPMGFYGVRGKKYPYEFRGKFVGVRGKKSDDDIDEAYFGNSNFRQLGHDLDLNQLMLLLTEQDEVDSNNVLNSQ